MCLFIGAGDIIEGNLKLILGLVWTLILHYQISLGFDIDDDNEGGPRKSGKQALLEYIQVCKPISTYSLTHLLSHSIIIITITILE